MLEYIHCVLSESKSYLNKSLWSHKMQIPSFIFPLITLYYTSTQTYEDVGAVVKCVRRGRQRRDCRDHTTLEEGRGFPGLTLTNRSLPWKAPMPFQRGTIPAITSLHPLLSASFENHCFIILIVQPNQQVLVALFLHVFFLIFLHLQKT